MLILSRNCLVYHCRRLRRSARTARNQGRQHLYALDAEDLLNGVGCVVRFLKGGLNDRGNSGVPFLVPWPWSDGSK